ncbi:hypothetical protein BDV26DRAFT_220921 [Aspergillus bertholletiae]|uniref:Uncharacterized protein n=1 Tax=Aspergillus bertholletiae TaxID=1226010 RepID=A0A5N7B4U0_9EURO|nr:hypothetical protein BDV26DRAFT_220921 [Aspergillus bertholletiae]
MIEKQKTKETTNSQDANTSAVSISGGEWSWGTVQPICATFKLLCWTMLLVRVRVWISFPAWMGDWDQVACHMIPCITNPGGAIGTAGRSSYSGYLILTRRKGRLSSGRLVGSNLLYEGIAVKTQLTSGDESGGEKDSLPMAIVEPGSTPL